MIVTTSPKLARSGFKASNALDTTGPSFYVHPYLRADHDPSKGRLLRASASIRAGTVLLVDTPYAVVPTAHLSEHASLICSNLLCSRRVAQTGQGVRCPKGCLRDVTWCDSSCRNVDHARHEYECLWLKQNGEMIRRQERQYDFATLWHVVRLLAGWDLEMREPSSLPHAARCDDGFEQSWESVEACCDYLESWPESQLEHWKRLVEKYLSPSSGLPRLPNPDKLLSLICKEETNTFGLYPKVTGPVYAIDAQESRGDCYGFGLYPRAAMFNHSCLPNVTHLPDSLCRMVYTAARDIAEGEECVITYFDLALVRDVASRQKLVQELFRFKCSCERCTEEEVKENLRDMASLPFGVFT